MTCSAASSHAGASMPVGQQHLGRAEARQLGRRASPVQHAGDELAGADVDVREAARRRPRIVVAAP